ncbi:mucin-4-like [Schistocerca americana]|uniref:mucin-4-like n=1 Tax=Schistocerca americana TaxID=7009 RepID=UPI001F500008|nr:mucin-4-like [Schistocerca americana]
MDLVTGEGQDALPVLEGEVSSSTSDERGAVGPDPLVPPPEAGEQMVVSEAGVFPQQGLEEQEVEEEVLDGSVMGDVVSGVPSLSPDTSESALELLCQPFEPGQSGLGDLTDSCLDFIVHLQPECQVEGPSVEVATVEELLSEDGCNIDPVLVGDGALDDESVLISTTVGEAELAILQWGEGDDQACEEVVATAGAIPTIGSDALLSDDSQQSLSSQLLGRGDEDGDPAVVAAGIRHMPGLPPDSTTAPEANNNTIERSLLEIFATEEVVSTTGNGSDEGSASGSVSPLVSTSHQLPISGGVSTTTLRPSAAASSRVSALLCDQSANSGIVQRPLRQSQEVYISVLPGQSDNSVSGTRDENVVQQLPTSETRDGQCTQSGTRDNELGAQQIETGECSQSGIAQGAPGSSSADSLNAVSTPSVRISESAQADECTQSRAMDVDAAVNTNAEVPQAEECTQSGIPRGMMRVPELVREEISDTGRAGDTQGDECTQSEVSATESRSRHDSDGSLEHYGGRESHEAVTESSEHVVRIAAEPSEPSVSSVRMPEVPDVSNTVAEPSGVGRDEVVQSAAAESSEGGEIVRRMAEPSSETELLRTRPSNRQDSAICSALQEQPSSSGRRRDFVESVQDYSQVECSTGKRPRTGESSPDSRISQSSSSVVKRDNVSSSGNRQFTGSKGRSGDVPSTPRSGVSSTSTTSSGRGQGGAGISSSSSAHKLPSGTRAGPSSTEAGTRHHGAGPSGVRETSEAYAKLSSPVGSSRSDIKVPGVSGNVRHKGSGGIDGENRGNAAGKPQVAQGASQSSSSLARSQPHVQRTESPSERATLNPQATGVLKLPSKRPLTVEDCSGPSEVKRRLSSETAAGPTVPLLSIPLPPEQGTLSKTSQNVQSAAKVAVVPTDRARPPVPSPRPQVSTIQPPVSAHSSTVPSPAPRFSVKGPELPASHKPISFTLSKTGLKKTVEHPTGESGSSAQSAARLPERASTFQKKKATDQPEEPEALKPGASDRDPSEQNKREIEHTDENETHRTGVTGSSEQTPEKKLENVVETIEVSEIPLPAGIPAPRELKVQAAPPPASESTFPNVTDVASVPLPPEKPVSGKKDVSLSLDLVPSLNVSVEEIPIPGETGEGTEPSSATVKQGERSPTGRTSQAENSSSQTEGKVLSRLSSPFDLAPYDIPLPPVEKHTSLSSSLAKPQLGEAGAELQSPAKPSTTPEYKQSSDEKLESVAESDEPGPSSNQVKMSILQSAETEVKSPSATNLQTVDKSSAAVPKTKVDSRHTPSDTSSAASKSDTTASVIDGDGKQNPNLSTEVSQPSAPLTETVPSVEPSQDDLQKTSSELQSLKSVLPEAKPVAKLRPVSSNAPAVEEPGIGIDSDSRDSPQIATRETASPPPAADEYVSLCQTENTSSPIEEKKNNIPSEGEKSVEDSAGVQIDTEAKEVTLLQSATKASTSVCSTQRLENSSVGERLPADQNLAEDSEKRKVPFVKADVNLEQPISDPTPRVLKTRKDDCQTSPLAPAHASSVPKSAVSSESKLANSGDIVNREVTPRSELPIGAPASQVVSHPPLEETAVQKREPASEEPQAEKQFDSSMAPSSEGSERERFSGLKDEQTEGPDNTVKDDSKGNTVEMQMMPEKSEESMKVVAPVEMAVGQDSRLEKSSKDCTSGKSVKVKEDKQKQSEDSLAATSAQNDTNSETELQSQAEVKPAPQQENLESQKETSAQSSFHEAVGKGAVSAASQEVLKKATVEPSVAEKTLQRMQPIRDNSGPAVKETKVEMPAPLTSSPQMRKPANVDMKRLGVPKKMPENNSAAVAAEKNLASITDLGKGRGQKMDMPTSETKLKSVHISGSSPSAVLSADAKTKIQKIGIRRTPSDASSSKATVGTPTTSQTTTKLEVQGKAEPTTAQTTPKLKVVGRPEVVKTPSSPSVPKRATESHSSSSVTVKKEVSRSSTGASQSSQVGMMAVKVPPFREQIRRTQTEQHVKPSSSGVLKLPLSGSPSKTSQVQTSSKVPPPEGSVPPSGQLSLSPAPSRLPPVQPQGLKSAVDKTRQTPVVKKISFGTPPSLAEKKKLTNLPFQSVGNTSAGASSALKGLVTKPVGGSDKSQKINFGKKEPTEERTEVSGERQLSVDKKIGTYVPKKSTPSCVLVRKSPSVPEMKEIVPESYSPLKKSVSMTDFSASAAREEKPDVQRFAEVGGGAKKPSIRSLHSDTAAAKQSDVKFSFKEKQASPSKAAPSLSQPSCIKTAEKRKSAGDGHKVL